MDRHAMGLIFMIDWDTFCDLAGILGIWIFIFAVGFRVREGDSDKLKLAKSLMRTTFTVTLVLVVLMTAWVLYVVKTR